jgi:TFIIF-interacting CTD phosphatase-like protein
MTTLYIGLRIGNTRHKRQGIEQQTVPEQDASTKLDEDHIRNFKSPSDSTNLEASETANAPQIGEELMEEKHVAPRYQL